MFLTTLVLFAIVQKNKPPIQIKDIIPGMSWDDYIRSGYYSESSQFTDNDDLIFAIKGDKDTDYTEKLKLPGVEIHSSEYIFLKSEKKLYTAKIKFSRLGFDDLVDAFTVKYGKPKYSYSNNIQNISGAQFINKIYRWESQTAYLEIQSRYSKINEGVILLVDKALKNEFDSQSKMLTEKRAKDL